MRERLAWHLERLPKDSKPGVPYLSLGNNNQDILPNNKELIINATIERLKILWELDLEKRNLSPRELVEIGACDPVRLFVKGEPHSKRKVKSKRWRLIMATSVVDSLVERVMCYDQNKVEISEWEDIPSAPGINLLDQQAMINLYKDIHARKGDVAEADVTGWDWSVQASELRLEGLARGDLCSASPVLRTMFVNREYCVANAVYALPDGTLVAKDVPGVQCSGRFNTSSTNSRLRVALAYLVGSEWAKAMGDDCLEQFIEDAERKYAERGHPLKMYNRKEDKFEFCSQIMSSTGCCPADGTKSLYRLIEQPEITGELLAQFAEVMHMSPRYSEFLASVSRVRDRRRANDAAQEVQEQCAETTPNASQTSPQQ